MSRRSLYSNPPLAPEQVEWLLEQIVRYMPTPAEFETNPALRELRREHQPYMWQKLAHDILPGYYLDQRNFIANKFAALCVTGTGKSFVFGTYCPLLAIKYALQAAGPQPETQDAIRCRYLFVAPQKEIVAHARDEFVKFAVKIVEAALPADMTPHVRRCTVRDVTAHLQQLTVGSDEFAAMPFTHRFDKAFFFLTQEMAYRLLLGLYDDEFGRPLPEYPEAPSSAFSFVLRDEGDLAGISELVSTRAYKSDEESDLRYATMTQAQTSALVLYCSGLLFVWFFGFLR